MKLPCFGGLPFHARWKYPKLSVFILISLVIVLIFVFEYRPWAASDWQSRRRPPRRVPVMLINWNKTNLKSKKSCHFHTCFEINDCIFGRQDRIRVYVHDHYEFHSPITSQSYVPDISTEYTEILDTIRNSRYYERNISKACVIVPPIDTLNQQQHETKLVSILLNSLPG